jgi:hypothetical protein
LVGKPEGKRSLRRWRPRWVDNIKMDRREIGWDGLVSFGLVWFGLVWFGLDQSGSGWGPVEGSCEHSDETSGSITCLSGCTIGGFWRRAQLHEVILQVFYYWSISSETNLYRRVIYLLDS